MTVLFLRLMAKIGIPWNDPYCEHCNDAYLLDPSESTCKVCHDQQVRHYELQQERVQGQ